MGQNLLLRTLILFGATLIQCFAHIYIKGEDKLSPECKLDDANKLQSRTGTECILYCERKQKKPLLKQGSCYCVEKSCMFEKGETSLLAQNYLYTKVTKGWLLATRHPICFGAKLNDPASFTLTATGTVNAFKLIHVSGSVTCDVNNPALEYGNWGCYNDEIDVYVTDEENKIHFPFTTWNGRYKLHGVYNNSTELILTSPSPNGYHGEKNAIMKIWYGEDLVTTTEDDNGGRSCVRVFVKYESIET